MVIQHNLQSLNANRMSGIVTSERAKSAEKLASGYKINRAADNAASLQISEKMRKQIRGLDRASINGKDGISLVQVADGALQEVHEMLQRCNELAIQAANGTLSPSDRMAINNEIKQLKSEINTITARTKFNETPVFCRNGYLPRFNPIEPPASVRDGVKKLAQKITEEYYPNAVEQILNSFSSIGAPLKMKGEEDKTPFNTTLSINYIDGVNGAAASVTAGFTYPDQGFASGSLLMQVDNDDFPSLDLPSSKLSLIETTTAHEVMHGVMDTMFPTRMYRNSSPEDFPLWFIEGTAQLAGGGFTGGWNSTLTAIAGSLSSENDRSKDSVISSYLSMSGYTVDNAVYGHGYLAAAYASYLAADGNDVFQKTILNGANKLFQNFLDDPMGSYSEIFENTVGLSEADLKAAINDGQTYSTVPGKVSAVEFVRKLAYQSLGGVGSLIAPSLSTGGQNVLGDTAKKEKQPLRITNSQTKYVAMTIDEDKSGHGASLALHLGSDADMTNKIEVYRFDMSTDALRLTETNLLTADKATDAIDDFGNAIMMVSGVRSYFGAVQNRVEHTVYNLNNVTENTTAAESRIRDTDMAEEMVRLSTLNILQQAGQSILAQANQTPQGVMALLQQ